MNLSFFHQWASPKWFYRKTAPLLSPLALLAALLLILGLAWGLIFAPPDYQQGNSFRIIYLHVPAAILAQSIYLFLAISGLISLVWKIKLADIALKEAAPIGASMCFLALVSGAIWGKPTWGAWWVWDARLTSMLILLFLYLGIIGLGSAIRSPLSAGKACALLALVGVVNIPIIKYSVEWWNTLHQPSTFKLSEKPSMPPAMWLPLLISVLGFYCFFAATLLGRMRLELLRREQRTQWASEELSRSGA